MISSPLFLNTIGFYTDDLQEFGKFIIGILPKEELQLFSSRCHDMEGRYFLTHRISNLSGGY